MPNVLYKFVSTPTSVEKIAAGNLKFATISELNDPNEMLAEMNEEAVETSLHKIRRTGYSESQFQWLKHQAAVLKSLAPKKYARPCPRNKEEATRILQGFSRGQLRSMIEYNREVIETMQKEVGILSLTSAFQSLPMWAHYANNAAGFVVEFQGLGTVFRENETGSLNVLKPVKYYTDYIGMTFDPATQDSLFFSKHQSWSYEHEWRVVLPLAECSDKSIPGLHVKKIPASHIAAVIFGWRCSDTDKSAVVDAVSRVNPNAFFRQASLLHGKVILTDMSLKAGGR